MTGGGEDDMEYCKIGGCDREQHVDSQDGMCLPCGVAYESGWHDCFDEKVRGVRGRQEIQEKKEEIRDYMSRLVASLQGDVEHFVHMSVCEKKAKVEALQWVVDDVLGEVEDL